MQKTRQANFEVLRIVAMFMVLVTHADFLSFYFPESIPEDTTSQIIVILRTLCETMCIVSVNVFVMISGYWGIKFSFRKLFSFCFQILFWGFLVTFSVLKYEGVDFDKDAVDNILMFNRGFWFVKSYLFLFILAPILNTFIKYASEKEFRFCLILFYSFQFIYGWLYLGVSWFSNGYSAVSFVGLYLLAGYFRHFRRGVLNKWFCLGGYFLASVVSAIMILYSVHEGSDPNFYLLLHSPFLLLGTVMFFLFFEKLEVKPRKYIFFLSSSCFAVYLLHCNEYSIGYFCEIVNYLESITSATGGTLLFLMVLLIFLSIVFVVAVLIDKIRMRLNDWILRLYSSLVR